MDRTFEDEIQEETTDNFNKEKGSKYFPIDGCHFLRECLNINNI